MRTSHAATRFTFSKTGRVVALASYEAEARRGERDELEGWGAHDLQSLSLCPSFVSQGKLYFEDSLLGVCGTRLLSGAILSRQCCCKRLGRSTVLMIVGILGTRFGPTLPFG